MFLKNITITNFRGIEELSIPFEKGINLLIGDNGMGKTSILEAIAVGLGGLFYKVSGVTSAGFLQEDFREEKITIADASTQILYHSPSVEMLLDINGESYSCIRRRKERSGSGKTETSGSAPIYLGKIVNIPNAKLPLFSYLGISRVVLLRCSDYGKNFKNTLNDRRCGYIGCLDTILDKKSIIEWVKKISYEAILKSKDVQELTFFQTTISRLMMEINGLETEQSVYYSSVYDELVYESFGKELSTGMLSAGYQSVLNMAMDLAFRIALLNPTIHDSAEAEGIVLIDEIDMHLHPKWQWNILNALEKVFPNVQFIIATHAPIVISSCKNSTLLTVTDNAKVEVSDGAYAYGIQDVLVYTQGSSGVLPKLRELYQEFEEAYIVRDRNAAKSVYEQICAEFPDSTEASKARTRLSFLG